MPEEVQGVRSPTKTLIDCLEQFGESEPDSVIVVYTNSDGDICYSFSGPFSFSRVIGMLECVKAEILKKFLDD